MFIKPSKFLMSEEGASPGGGAAPVPPAEPTAAPTAPSLDVDSLITRITSVIDEKIIASQNATHAALRKAGVFEKAKTQIEPSASAAAQPTQSAPTQAQAGLSMADVEALLERERVIATRAAKHNLTEQQTRRLKASLSNVPVDSFATEVDSYLQDMGLVKAPTQTATQVQTQAAPAQPAKPNISDRGTAAPTDARDSNAVLNRNPLEITAHDMDTLILQHGQTEGLRRFQEQALAALSRVRIKPPRG